MKIKKVTCVAILSLFVLLILPLMPTFAVDTDEVIRVGYYSAYTDFVEDMDSLNAKGYGYDVFKKIEEISDLRFEFVAIDGDLTEAMQNDIIDVAGLNIRSEKRKELLTFSQTAYTKTYVALMTSDMQMPYNTPAEIDGKTVATYEDNIGQTALETYCEWNDISVDYVYGDVYNYTDLEADFYIMYSEDRKSSEYNNVLNLGVYNLYLTTIHENADVLAEIDRIFYQIVTTEGNFFMELEEKYLADNLEINHRSLTQVEIEILQERPLEVAYLSDYQPISFTDANGEPDGSMVATFNVFAQRYGFDVNYHAYSIHDEPSVIDGYDVVITMYGHGDYIYEGYLPTETYFELPVYAQVKQNVYESTASTTEMLENSPKIGTLMYQNIDYDAFVQKSPYNEFVFYTDWHQLLDDFDAGVVDMMISTQSGTQYIEMYLQDTKKVAVQTELKIPMQFFISKDISQEYLPIFNIMLDRVTEREYAAILTKYSNQYYPENNTSFLEFAIDYWYYFALGAVFIATSYFIFILIAQKRKKDALLVAYSTDALTGFMALNKFSECLEETLKTAKPKEYEIYAFDVDMFKTINTHFSAEKGTAVILAIANGLKEAFEGTSAMICRKTADNFLVFRKVGDGGSMQQIYRENILPKITEVLGEKYHVHMSFGNAVVTNCQSKSTAIMGYADIARQEGKNQTITTFITFNDKMKKFYKNKVDITFRMERALKDREFYIVFQPKINFETLKLGGAEALVRWQPKFGSTIYPDEFIPVFEQNGFIAELDLYVLEETCKFIVANSPKMDIPRISVNLSAHTVTADNVVARISDILTKYEIDPSEIELELTESAIDSSAETFLLRVKQFKALGLLISIDDFGAGVSSLNRLSAIEADILKLDKAFFDLKDQGGKSAIVVTNVVQMAKELNMLVVAEGVETYAQALWLRSIKCDYAQGYYFAKPLPQEEFKELVLSKKQYQIN